MGNDNSEAYLRKASELRRLASETANPFAAKSYSKLAQEYARLAHHAALMSDQGIESLAERIVGRPDRA